MVLHACALIAKSHLLHITLKMFFFYLHKDALHSAAVLADGLLAVGGVENLIGWDSGVGHTFLSSQHPYDNIRHTVLRLYCEFKQT